MIGFKHNINIEVGNSTKIYEVIFVLMNQESFFWMGQHVGHILQDFRLLPRPKDLSLSALSFLYVCLNLVRKLWDINIGIRYMFFPYTEALYLYYMNSKDFNISKQETHLGRNRSALPLPPTVSSHKSRASVSHQTHPPLQLQANPIGIRKETQTHGNGIQWPWGPIHQMHQLHSATVYKQMKQVRAMFMAK